MPVKVHIYVATTQGLVAIQNMTLLEEPGVRSLVTIDGSAKLAGISGAYDLFVNSPAGLIKQHFGGAAYRVNVDGNIDQGDSWQLGFYLSHMFYSSNQLSQHEVSQGDIALCVTGAVSSFDLSVKQIASLDKKMLSAKGQIMHWMNNGVMVQWVMPEANNLGETLGMPCSCFGVHSLYDCANKLVSRGILREIPPCLLKPQEEDSPQLEMLLPSDVQNRRPNQHELTQQDHKEEITIAQQRTLQKKIYVLAAFISLSIVSAITLFLSYQYFQGASEPAKLLTTQSDNGQCDQSIYQNTMLLDESPIVTLPELSLTSLCEVNFELGDSIKSVWLIADSGAVIRLANIDRKWQFPLPKQRSIKRSYTLVSSKEYFDEADYQSFSAFITSVSQGFEAVGQVSESEAFDMADIAPWFSQQQYSVTFYSGALQK